MIDTYRHILTRHEVTLKVKGSRFIATAMPASSSDEVESLLTEVRKTHHSATHHCYAYVVGVEPDVASRYSDDGEPSGTAGAPILRRIHGLELTNTLVVVTRYYGGTKLGTGGLSRAYGGAAGAALEAAPTATATLRSYVDVTFWYDDTSQVQHLIALFRADIIDSQYADRALLRVAVPRSKVSDFVAGLTDLLAGRVECVLITAADD